MARPTGAQRHPIRTFIVIALAVAMVTVAMSTFDYMLVPMQEDLGFSLDSANVVLLIPEIGGLALVFAAGVLGDRLGRRTMIVASAVVFTVGAMLVSVAPALPVVVVGRVLGGAGAIIAAVTALALLGETYVERRQRALAFGANAALIPAMWIVAPIAGAWLVEQFHWRAAGIGWIAMGAAAGVAALTLLPRDRRSQRPAELVTPLLGGIVLAGFAGAIMAASLSAFGAVLALGSLALAAATALAFAMRAVARPALDLRLVRSFRGTTTLGAIVVANTADLLFFTTLILQFRFGTGALALALVMIPVQVLGTLGGLASGPLMDRIGVLGAGVATMFLTGVLALIVLPLDAGTTAWVVVATAAVFGLFDASTSGPATARVMDLAGPGNEGAGAAHRQAWKGVGTAVGGVLAGILVFGAFQTALAGNLQDRGVPAGMAEQVAADVRNGALAADVARTYDAPPPGIVELTGESPAALADAQFDAYRVAGIVTCIGYLAAAALLAASGMRRQRAP